MQHRYLILPALVALLLMTTGCAGPWTVPGTPVPAPQPLPTLEAYMAQHIGWRPCENGEADCGSIRVPVDYADPGAMAITMPLIRLRATNPAARLGVLTANPGGPGESGYEQVRYALDPKDTGLRKFRIRYDLVGFDPRGVGRTAAVNCLSDKEMDDYLATDFTPTDAAGLRRVADAHTRYATACLRKTGKLLGFVGTEFVARDMDIMRSALGEEKLNYFGFSYGTRLGQYYADQFPAHVGRMVLDSIDDPSWTTGRWDFTPDPQPPDPTRISARDQVVRDMLTACAARSDCPLDHDPDIAMRKLRELIDRVDRDPIPTKDGRMLGSNLAVLGIFEATYDEAKWPRFERAFADALHGDGTGLAQLADRYVGRSDTGRYSSSDPAFWAVQCANDDPKSYRSKSQEQILAELQREADLAEVTSPLFGRNRAFSTPLCLFWPVPPTSASKTVHAAGAPTIVLLNNTGDPATPLDDAEHVAKELADAVLVVSEHEGHIAFDNGSACVDAAVVGYFFDGVVPERGTRCHD
ncbi:alpha/beta hydrolase [Nocardia nepalensis]|uniref:alpha/beta hydrolase n=1 Tax=Nocardia nepalensis TaxID=3375448 RepID=UPI003B67D048